jgi:hypothetical protein
MRFAVCDTCHPLLLTIRRFAAAASGGYCAA